MSDVALGERALGLQRPRARAQRPIRSSRSSTSLRTGGSLPDSGMILAIVTHWSPIRSTWRMTCSSAATTRRSPATGACSASSDRMPWWTSM